MKFIADIGSNWRVSSSNSENFKRAELLTKRAIVNGATHVKFQLFRAEALHREEATRRQLKKFELPIEWLRPLQEIAHNMKAELLVTPFYPDAVDILENIGVPEYKIASWDLTYEPLLQRVYETGKPVIVSVGAAFDEEIDKALEILAPEGRDLSEITILHCTGGYPTPPEEAVLQRIVELANDYFPIRVGFSSHLANSFATAATVLYDVQTIEAHFDLSDELGVESGHSLVEGDFRNMVDWARLLNKMRDCNCEQTFGDFNARMAYRRDPSDWLRPVLKEEKLQ